MPHGPAISPSEFALAGTVGAVFASSVYSASGGTAPYTWFVSGELPPGITFSGDNQFVGTPTTAGSYPFTLNTIDVNDSVITQPFTFEVISLEVFLQPQLLPDATVGTGYGVQFAASGGNGGPFAFFLLDGTLPSGLALSGTGKISGTPTAAGAYTFMVYCRDLDSNATQREYTITVHGKTGGTGGGGHKPPKAKPSKPPKRVKAEGDFYVEPPGAAEFMAASDAADPPPPAAAPAPAAPVVVPEVDLGPTRRAIQQAQASMARVATAAREQQARLAAAQLAQQQRIAKVLAIVNFVEQLSTQGA